MKKILPYVIISLALTACSESVEPVKETISAPRSSSTSHSSSSSRPTMPAIFYQELGLLPFKGKGQFVLGELDHLGRPTGGQIQYRHGEDFETAIPDDADALFKLPGFVYQVYSYAAGDETRVALYDNSSYPLLPGIRIWDTRNLSLLTTYTIEGHKKEGLSQNNLMFYRKPLLSWLEQHDGHFLDYKISLLYEGDEVVPRQVKLQYVGLTPDGQLVPIDLGGKAFLNDQGIGTVILDNLVSQVTLDYKTGKILSRVYPDPTEQVDEERVEVYVPYDDSEWFYYYELPYDDRDYFTLTEEEAIEEGYEPGD